MNKKYLMNGLAALAIVAGISSCTKDVTAMSPVDEAQKAKENAELQLGFVIPDGQTWDMASQVEANVNVDLTAGETYSVAVYSNDPFADGKGVVLAKGSVKSGSAFSESFTCGNDRQQLWIAVTDKNNYTLYKLANVENGKVSADFSEASAASRSMRSIKVQDDPFTREDTKDYYKTSIPSTAKTIDDYRRADWGGGIDENALQNCTEFKFVDGTFAMHCWQGSRDIYVSGEVTFNVNDKESLNQARIYLIPGSTLNFNMGKYINNLEIYVAKGATLYYNAEKLYNQTGGGKIYSAGTVYFQDNFEANQNSVVYNEGIIYGKDITSKPGDGNKSFFYNFGTLNLTGKMELNSCSNFYNEGTVTVAGNTSVTQQKIYWINNGHYTTGSMQFSAKNTTFYNYCQLIVKGNAHMYDGEFNLMTDSYCEAATAEFDNFIVNMADNAGFKVIGDTKWEAQGDGTYQGFKATGSKAYVYLGGTATVAAHLRSMVFSGNVTCAIGDITDKGASNTGVQPTYVLNNPGVSRVDIKDVTFTAPTEEECAGTWKKGGTPKYETPQVYTYAFEDQTLNTDYDMNDVVLKVSYAVEEEGTGENEGNVIYDKSNLVVELVALGATYEITAKIGNADLFEGKELHAAMGQKKGIMINTGGTGGNSISGVATQKCIVAAPAGWNGEFAELPVSIAVSTTNKTYAFPNDDVYPHVIMVPTDWAWPTERTNIKNAYAGTTAAKEVEITYTATYTNKETNELVTSKFTNKFRENSFAAWATSPATSRNATMNGWFNNPTGDVMTNTNNNNSNN